MLTHFSFACPVEVQGRQRSVTSAKAQAALLLGLNPFRRGPRGFRVRRPGKPVFAHWQHGSKRADQTEQHRSNVAQAAQPVLNVTKN